MVTVDEQVLKLFKRKVVDFHRIRLAKMTLLFLIMVPVNKIVDSKTVIKINIS